jgi:anaerobic selenocysteine-containing dehydrogenase
VLSAGERRSDTSNTSIRDASWHRRGTFGTLRMHPSDAEQLGCKEGDWVRMTTRRGNAEAPVELGEDLQPGHVALPNGHGLDYVAADGSAVHKGVSLNELTDTDSRDPYAGTPFHKYVPVRIVRRDAPQEAGA